MEHKRSHSKAWRYFRKKPGLLATCKLCNNDFSYRGSVSNLTKHVMRKHGLLIRKNESHYSDDECDVYDSSFGADQTLDAHRYFEFTDTEDILRCKLCSKEVHNESVEDLMRHIQEDHGDDETDAEGEITPKSTKSARMCRSTVWNCFIRKPGMMAQCKLCNNDYSYKTSTSNLNKHFKRKHGINVVDTDYNSDDNTESRVVNERKFSTRRYFEVTDNEELMRCKLCSKEVHNESVAHLIKHIVEEHGTFDDTDTEGGNEDKPKSKLLVWLYFKPCPLTQTATCLVCRGIISYRDTVSNLKEHLEAKHPLVKFHGGHDSNRLLISADGDLYEVETGSPRVTLDDDEKDPIEMDTVYLDDFEDIPTDKKQRRSFERKKEPCLAKVKKDTSFNNYEGDNNYLVSKRPSFKRKRREMYGIKKEVHTSSSDDELVNNHKVKSKETHLDLFGQYIVSLLKELPKRLSDQLQGDIVKQIITAKVIHEAEINDQVTVPVTVSNGVTAPVTDTDTIPVTESESGVGSVSVLVCDSDGTIKSIKTCE